MTNDLTRTFLVDLVGNGTSLDGVSLTAAELRTALYQGVDKDERPIPGIWEDAFCGSCGESALYCELVRTVIGADAAAYVTARMHVVNAWALVTE